MGPNVVENSLAMTLGRNPSTEEVNETWSERRESIRLVAHDLAREIRSETPAGAMRRYNRRIRKGQILLLQQGFSRFGFLAAKRCLRLLGVWATDFTILGLALAYGLWIISSIRHQGHVDLSIFLSNGATIGAFCGLIVGLSRNLATLPAIQRLLSMSYSRTAIAYLIALPVLVTFLGASVTTGTYPRYIIRVNVWLSEQEFVTKLITVIAVLIVILVAIFLLGEILAPIIRLLRYPKSFVVSSESLFHKKVLAIGHGIDSLLLSILLLVALTVLAYSAVSEKTRGVAGLEESFVYVLRVIFTTIAVCLAVVTVATWLIALAARLHYAAQRSRHRRRLQLKAKHLAPIWLIVGVYLLLGFVAFICVLVIWFLRGWSIEVGNTPFEWVFLSLITVFGVLGWLHVRWQRQRLSDEEYRLEVEVARCERESAMASVSGSDQARRDPADSHQNQELSMILIVIGLVWNFIDWCGGNPQGKNGTKDGQD